MPDIASAYRSRMKVADLSSQEELAIFQQAFDVEEAGILLKNDMEILDVVMDSPSLDDTMPDNERLMRAIKKQTGAKIVRLPYTVIRNWRMFSGKMILPCAALSEEQETKRISLYMMFLQRKKS